jgi:riboflavin-specific deaminase-like protein
MGDRLTEAAWGRLLALAERARKVREAPGEQDGLSGPDGSVLAAAGRALAGEIGCELALLYLDLIAAIGQGPLSLAQLGQSLDGRIATESGHSRYINGAESLDHLHRLRALADAVIVGASTVALDNPRLTTRRVQGPSPMRVVLDPRARLAADANVFDDSAPTLVITDAGGAAPVLPHPAAARGVEVLSLPARDGRLPPADILVCLRQRGLRTVLIEGGAHTISTFLAERCIDRMLVAVAPMLIGSGTAAIRLPPILRIDEALRFAMRPYRLGADVVFDCDLRRPAPKPFPTR